MTTAQDQDSTPADADEPQTPPQTRPKVTGDELEARLSAWAEAQRDKRAARTVDDRRRRLRTRLTLGLGLVILALVLVSAVTNEQLTASESEKTTQISELQSELDEKQNEPDAVDTSAALASLTDAAATDGAAVAAAQQHFVELFHTAGTEPMPGNGVPSSAMLATVEQRRVLAPFFDPGSYIVTDEEEAYSWMSLTPFNVNSEIDPRYEWYIRYDDQKASPPTAYTWTLETVMPDMDASAAGASTDRAQVIWICREADGGDVLAWASAIYKYDGKSGVFDDLEVVVTPTGDEHTLVVTDGAAQ